MKVWGPWDLWIKTLILRCILKSLVNIYELQPERAYIFSQKDNDTLHSSRETTQWKPQTQIPCMNWTPQSPDINIIENVWKVLKFKLQKRVGDIKSRQVLIEYGSH